MNEFYETFSPDEVYTCCPLELQKAPLRGKDVGTVSCSFRPYARTTREFKWDGDTHMSGDLLKAFMFPVEISTARNGTARVNPI